MSDVHHVCLLEQETTYPCYLSTPEMVHKTCNYSHRGLNVGPNGFHKDLYGNLIGVAADKTQINSSQRRKLEMDKTHSCIMGSISSIFNSDGGAVIPSTRTITS